MSNPVDPSPQNPVHADRRRFFLFGVSAALNALSDLVQRASPIQLPAMRIVLRPPGALAEKEFLKTCYRCGSCVDSCPVHAIKPLQSTDQEQSGTPFIDPDIQACQLCDTLPCTKACPSGTLARISLEKVRIGLACWSSGKCLRAAGQECRSCLDCCPVPGAIRLGVTGQIEIVNRRCVGCGACQQICPARPKAIRVQPL